MRYLLLVLLWAGFCTLHSALISQGFKAWAQRRMGGAFRFHRLAYNLFSLLTLVPVLAYAGSLRTAPFFAWTGRWALARAALLALAALGFVLGARAHDLSWFIGWAQVKEGSGRAEAAPAPALSTQGILGLVRHPWYAAVFPLLWANDLDGSVLLTNLVLSVYVVIGTRLEEAKLVAEFGEVYREYQRNVSMYFPWKWARARIRALAGR